MENDKNIENFIESLLQLPNELRKKVLSGLVSTNIALSNVEKNTLNDSNKTEMTQVMGLEQSNLLQDLLAGKKDEKYTKRFYDLINKSIILEQKYRHDKLKLDGVYQRMANASFDSGNIKDYEKYNTFDNIDAETQKQLLIEEFNSRLLNIPNYKFNYSLAPSLETNSNLSNPSLINYNYNLIFNNNDKIPFLKLIYNLVDVVNIYDSLSNPKESLLEVKFISDNAYNTFSKEILTVTYVDTLIRAISNEGDKAFTYNIFSQENLQSERKLILKGEKIN
jgi:hypothetical protein